jgi:hypothetical protein
MGILELVHLLSVEFSSIMVLGVPPLVNSSVPSAQLDEAIQSLAEQPNITRIKKLLVYACTQTWESDPHRLDAVHLHELVQTLFSIAPTAEHLQVHLTSVANSLNKATEYLAVANQIITQLHSVYLAAPAESVARTQPSYLSVAQKLEADPQSLRIKKLLILVSKKQWIADRHQLDRMSMADLVQAVCQLAPTLDNLQQVLANRVKKLSKAAEYSLIAERLVLNFCECYEAKPLALENTSEATQYLTELVGRSNSSTKVGQSCQESIQLPKSPTQNSIQKPLALPDLFDLRLEIMRYANPFRTKILLFSLLHEPFQHTSEHNLMIKNHELDDLLRLTIQTHPSAHLLEANLLKVLKSLDEPNEYHQIIKTIMHIVASIYPISPTSIDSPSTIATSGSEISGGETDCVFTIASS